MTGKDYFKLYKHFKAKCHKLSLEVNRLQTVMDSCKMLLEGRRQVEVEHSLSCSNISSLTSSTPGKLSFPEDNDATDDISNSIEPGANKWECLSDEERRQFLKTPSPHSKSQNVIKFEVDRGTENVETREVSLGNEKVEELKTSSFPKLVTMSKEKEYEFSTEYNSPPNQNQHMSRGNNYSPGHICKYPRCKKHQPFYVSSIRKMKELSPDSRRLATNKRGKSPKGFYSLSMPSTQEIRSRQD